MAGFLINLPMPTDKKNDYRAAAYDALVKKLEPFQDNEMVAALLKDVERYKTERKAFNFYSQLLKEEISAHNIQDIFDKVCVPQMKYERNWVGWFASKVSHETTTYQNYQIAKALETLRQSKKEDYGPLKKEFKKFPHHEQLQIAKYLNGEKIKLFAKLETFLTSQGLMKQIQTKSLNQRFTLFGHPAQEENPHFVYEQNGLIVDLSRHGDNAAITIKNLSEDDKRVMVKLFCSDDRLQVLKMKTVQKMAFGR